MCRNLHAYFITGWAFVCVCVCGVLERVQPMLRKWMYFFFIIIFLPLGHSFIDWCDHRRKEGELDGTQLVVHIRSIQVAATRVSFHRPGVG